MILILLSGISGVLALYCLAPRHRWQLLISDTPSANKTLPAWGWLVPTTAIYWVILPKARVWIVVVAALAATGAWLVTSIRKERKIAARRAKTARLCGSLAALLSAGDLPDRALDRLVEDHPELVDVVHARDIGGDVAEALARLGAQPGSEGLAAMSRAWALSHSTGAPLAPAVIGVADGIRQRRSLEQTVSAELASARSSGRLMAGLPLIGIAMGFTTGGDPINFLISNPIGQICLGAAVVLVCAGLLWTSRLGVGIETGNSDG